MERKGDRFISLLASQIFAAFALRINRLEHRTGTAWEGRFKCSPIESDRYLLACTRYVDLNPVRARMVTAPQDYLWSSYRARTGFTQCSWLDPDPCFIALGSTPQRRQQRYKEFVEQGIHEHELKFIRGAVHRNQLTGSEAFILEIEQRIGERILHRPRGRPRNQEK